MRYVVLGMLLLAMGSSWAENWQKLESFGKTHDFYLDADSVKRSGNDITFWYKELYPDTQEIIFYQLRADCHNFQVQFLHTSMRDKTGRHNLELPNPGTFELPPNTGLTKLVVGVCQPAGSQIL